METERERTIASLRDLSNTLREASTSFIYLSSRSHALADELQQGARLHEVMTAEERPLIITMLTSLMDSLQEKSGEVRRAEAAELRSEGLTHEQIAETFGVTRQRVAALLKSDGPPRRTPKRPRLDNLK